MSRIVNLDEVRQRQGKRIVDKAHTDRLRLLGCCICGRRDGGVQIHHLLAPDEKSTSRGMGKRAGDDQAVPLCAECHRHAHSPGAQRSFERKYGLRQEADYQWSISHPEDETDGSI